MIISVSHKGLRLLLENDDESKLPPHLVEKIRETLSLLDVANTPEQMNIAGYRLHKLSGELKEYWSVKVSGNYRIIFRFEDGNAYDLDYLDYH